MSTKVTVKADAPALMREAAAYVAAQIEAFLARAPRCTVALTGGTTIPAMNAVLAQRQLPWSRVDFFFGDERAVPPDDKESNFKGARDSLFAPLGLTAGQVFRMPADGRDLEAAARAYETQLPARLDLVVLGIGEDGHVCSLFPHHAALAEETRRVLAVTDSPKPPPHRLTLAPRALAEAASLVMVVSGKGKASAVRRALEEDGPVTDVPARLARRGTWFLDAAAASELASKGQGHG